mmetsp:Transcript_2069/g.4154  ORF Transcript_2069/g.4154 Transcript_2069/m.4154 type:complete len:280 (+) Transcript_2069:436-1275(+)
MHILPHKIPRPGRPRRLARSLACSVQKLSTEPCRVQWHLQMRQPLFPRDEEGSAGVEGCEDRPTDPCHVRAFGGSNDADTTHLHGTVVRLARPCLPEMAQCRMLRHSLADKRAEGSRETATQHDVDTTGEMTTSESFNWCREERVGDQVGDHGRCRREFGFTQILPVHRTGARVRHASHHFAYQEAAAHGEHADVVSKVDHQGRDTARGVHRHHLLRHNHDLVCNRRAGEAETLGSDLGHDRSICIVEDADREACARGIWLGCAPQAKLTPVVPTPFGQ